MSAPIEGDDAEAVERSSHADAIAQLLDDPRLATRIAAKGLETFVRDHSQQRIDADVARVVQQVLGGTSGHAQ